jgi:predicted SAM-dependent methyltransferase
MIKLNLGCGKLFKQGYINIDKSPDCNPDLVLDVCNGLPYKDNAIDEVHCGCMLEQIENNKDFVFVLNEIHRVLKIEGEFNGYVPSTNPDVLFLDPMDRRFFQEHTFDYFDINKHHWQEFGSTAGFKPWIVTKVELKDNGIIHFQMAPYKCN